MTIICAYIILILLVILSMHIYKLDSTYLKDFFFYIIGVLIDVMLLIQGSLRSQNNVRKK